MALLSYMQRRASGTYEFRRRLPEALAGKAAPAHMRETFAELINSKTGCFKRELVCSLRTKDAKEAKRRDHREALRACHLFDEAITAMAGGVHAPKAMTEAELTEIAAEVRAELLAGDEAERDEGDDRRRLQTAQDRESWPDLEAPVLTVPDVPATTVPDLPARAIPDPDAKGMTADHFLTYGDLLAELETEFRDALARRDPSIVRAETQIALKRRGIPIDRSSQAFRAAGMAVLQAHVAAYDAMRRRQGGDVVPTPAPSGDRGPKLSEAFAAWQAGGAVRGSRKPTARTVAEAEQVVRYFHELHGVVRLGDISREKARLFRDALARAPKGVPAKLRKLPLPKLLERDLSQYQSRSAGTINKLLGLLGAIISHAQRGGFLDYVPGFVNPFDKNIRFPLDDQDGGRALFDKADLRAIFGSPIFSDGSRPAGGGGEAAFWFPLIGLLSGMRLDEIAQLRICDVRQDEDSGRWFFNIGRDGGRSTKTASSVRCVPLHRELERIGLLLYRESLLARGAAPENSLWPGVKAADGLPRSAAWSKWFGRYLRTTLGIIDGAKVFHSFRHTFKRLTRDADIREEVHDALTGHAGNSKSVGRSYGRGVSLGPLVAAIDRVTAPINLGGVVWLPVARVRS